MSVRNWILDTFTFRSITAFVGYCGGGFAGLYFISLGFAGFYFPLRLYSTGQSAICTVSNIEIAEAGSDWGESHTDYYILTCQGLQGKVIAHRKFESSIAIGNALKAFYSESINEGFITRTASPSIFRIAREYSRYKPILSFVIFCVLVLPAYTIALSRTKDAFFEIGREQMALKNPTNNKLLSKLIVVKLILRYSVVFFFLYLLVRLLLNYLINIEKGQKVFVGFFLACSFMIIIFFSYFILFIKHDLEKRPVGQLVLTAMQIIVCAYACLKAFQFANHDFSNSENVISLLTEFVSYLFDP